MTIEERLTNLEANQLKLAELVERMANANRRTLQIIDELVTKLTTKEDAKQ